MATWNEQLQQIQKLRLARRGQDEELYRVNVNLNKIERLLQKVKRKETMLPPDENSDALEKKKQALEQQKKQLSGALAQSTKNLQVAIESIYVNPHPRASIANLSDGIPFLLLPVRIETRFVTSNNTSELWLRIYPDDIAIHTHEKTLTDKEVTEGEKYWKALFEAIKNGGDKKEDLKKSAWNALASLFGSQRAAWVALSTKPGNWSNDLSGISSASQLQFPPHDLTKTNAWSRAPRTNVLPDKFVVMLYEGKNIVIEQTGNVIPDELQMGPDPLDADNAFTNSNENEQLTFGASYDWISNFDSAVQNGMGFKISLTPEQASRGFTKVLVLGAYLSSDEATSQQAVETLIDNHHYSPKGFGILPQGTPTNNTDQGGSGYTKKDISNNNSYITETGDPLFTEADDCDGRNLADALGIQYSTLQYIANSNQTDLKEAVAMNTALYTSTLGYYFDTILQPVLDEGSRDKLRTFFIQHVSGRGPLPSIRVGNQPYGILVTSDFTAWRWGRSEPVWGVPFLNALYNVLNHYRGIWKDVLNDVAYIRKPGTDTSDTLMNILGLQASSVAFFQRTGYSTDDLINRENFKYGERYFADILNSLESKTTLLNFFSSLGYNITGNDGQLQVPQLLKIIFQHYHTALDASNLIDNVPLSEFNQIRNYDTALQRNYIDWLAQSSTVATLEKQDFGAGIKTPTSLLYLQLRRSLLLQLSKASVNWFKKNGVVLDQVLKPTNFYNIRTAGDITKWEVMKATVANAVPAHIHRNLAVADYLLTVGKSEDDAAFLNAMKDALTFLADKPTARLERCFTEHLDTCSYRLDAWESAIFDQRLKKQRQGKTVDGQQTPRSTGIYLGAYGWLENIRPDTTRQIVRDLPERLRPADGKTVYEYRDNGGFVHAPSINHASAAAVLRSGYLSHASAENPDAMAVNLSSERVRRALFILEGIRNGQTLEALLGYQFERGLHDRGSQNDNLKKLNEYIYDFRDAFPLEQHIVQQQGADAVTETIPANNVVNGVRLSENKTPFPYGATGDVTGATTDERNAIEAEKSLLDDSLDALKDLMLSESVFQMVQGNADRSSAVMNALKDAHIPPELDIINTPRSSQFSFTNRVTIQFETLKPGDVGYNPWPSATMTPRATMEPGINKWLKKIIGDAATLTCLVSHEDSGGIGASNEITADQLGLQPIDLVYISGNELNTGAIQPGKENKTAASELESRIAFQYRKMNALDDETPITIEFLKPDNAATKKSLGSMLPLLRMLKSIITDSRNLHAEDFDPPSKASQADSENPKGYDHAELLNRILQAQTVFQNLLNDLGGITITLNEVIDGVSGTISLQQFFDLLNTSGSALAAADISIDNTASVQLQQILTGIAGFGIPDAFPNSFSVADTDRKMLLLEQGLNTARRMNVMLETTAAFIADAAGSIGVEKKIGKLIDGAKALFGDSFNVLPLFAYNNLQDIQLSNGDRTQLLKYATTALKMNFAADEWLHNVSHVRSRLSRWEYVRTIYESRNIASPDSSLELFPIQLPYRANDSWIAVEFPSTNDDDTPFTILHDTLSIVVHGESASFSAGSQAGILLDEWTETIPVKEEITGISFNYNQPNATPPQALLLAVPAIEKGTWDWDELVGILNDTLLRAKLRAVEPALLDKINKPETGVLLPAILANFSQYDLDLALDYRINVSALTDKIPIQTAGLSS